MNTALKVFCLTVLLASCTIVEYKHEPTKVQPIVKLSLIDRIQTQIVDMQRDVLDALPDEIAGFKSVEPAANREQNKRGAGYTRVYLAGDIVATVFVYNDRDFDIPVKINSKVENLMDKHLDTFQVMQSYKNVKTGKAKKRNFRWRGVNYQVLEADVEFSQRDEDKKSLLVLGTNKDLMSYVRIHYTYPKAKQAEVNKKNIAFTRSVFVALHDFAVAQNSPVAQ